LKNFSVSLYLNNLLLSLLTKIDKNSGWSEIVPLGFRSKINGLIINYSNDQCSNYEEKFLFFSILAFITKFYSLVNVDNNFNNAECSKEFFNNAKSYLYNVYGKFSYQLAIGYGFLGLYEILSDDFNAYEYSVNNIQLIIEKLDLDKNFKPFCSLYYTLRYLFEENVIFKNFILKISILKNIHTLIN
jgi:hypothetical protein